MSAPAPRAVLGVLLATGDGDLETRLVAGLADEGMAVVARCLDAASLLDAIEAHTLPWGAHDGHTPLDVVLASTTLHGLTEATLLLLRDRRMPVLLLAADDRQAERFADLAPAVPASTPAAGVAEALRHLHAGAPLLAVEPPTPLSGAGDAALSDREGGERPSGRVIAVTSGKGAPGKSTVAIALAASLGRAGVATVLVDADLRGGNIAPYLDLDPRRGLVGLAVGGGPFDERLASALQDGPGCAALAGVERPELAEALPGDHVAGAIGRLRERFGWVVVDAGAPPDAAVLRAAGDVLLVTGADLVSIWNARVALRTAGDDLGGRIGAVVNRHEGREHYDAGEIERALGIPVLAVVREDRKAARHAIAGQTPLSAAGGRAAAELRRLAAALAEGAVWDAGTERPPALGAVAVET